MDAMKNMLNAMEHLSITFDNAERIVSHDDLRNFIVIIRFYDDVRADRFSLLLRSHPLSTNCIGPRFDHSYETPLGRQRSPNLL